MRWKMLDRPADGNEVSQWFAFWPVTVGGETRWLEWVAVEYRIVIAGYSDALKVRPGKIHKHAVRFIS
jgi:hypothetical protein